MTEENVFHWDYQALGFDKIKELPDWAQKQGSMMGFDMRPDIVPQWVRGNYQVAMRYDKENCYDSATINLYARIHFLDGGTCKWMPYAMVYMNNVPLITDMVEYLLSGNIERVYDAFIKERGWKDRRIEGE